MNFRAVLVQITPLNLLLLGIIAASVFYIYTNFININVGFAPPKNIAAETQEVKIEAEQTPSSVEYSIIADLNLFHPERIIPPEKKAEQLSKPDFVLYGIIIAEETKIAYLEDLKAPHTTAGRGKRQKTLQLGQTLSGYTLKEVHRDKILMTKAEDVIEVKINANRKARKSGTAQDGPSAATGEIATTFPAGKLKAGGQPPGVVHTGHPPAGVPVPDEQTISRVKETLGSGIIKRRGIQQQTEKDN